MKLYLEMHLELISDVELYIHNRSKLADYSYLDMVHTHSKDQKIEAARALIRYIYTVGHNKQDKDKLISYLPLLRDGKLGAVISAFSKKYYAATVRDLIYKNAFDSFYTDITFAREEDNKNLTHIDNTEYYNEISSTIFFNGKICNKAGCSMHQAIIANGVYENKLYFYILHLKRGTASPEVTLIRSGKGISRYITSSTITNEQLTRAMNNSSCLRIKDFARLYYYYWASILPSGNLEFNCRKFIQKIISTDYRLLYEEGQILLNAS